MAASRRRSRTILLMAVMPSVMLGGLLLSTLPTFASGNGIPGARSSTSASDTAKIVIAARVSARPRLSTNGTRQRSEQTTPSKQDDTPAAADNNPAGEAASSESENAKPAVAPAKPHDTQVTAAPEKPGATSCLAGCTTPTRGPNRGRDAVGVPARALEPTVAMTNSNGGGVDCIAGCYGSTMETTATRTAPPAETPKRASDKEGTSVTVLRGNTRKRVYPGRD